MYLRRRPEPVDWRIAYHAVRIAGDGVLRIPQVIKGIQCLEGAVDVLPSVGHD